MDERVAIDFTSREQCLALLAGLPLTRMIHVRTTVRQLLDGLRATPPAPEAYAEVLDGSRPALALVQEETAARYAGSALPPGAGEDDTLAQVVALWQAMGAAYAQVADLAPRAGVLTPERRALLAQRQLHYAGRAVVEYFRARRELPPGLWREANLQFSAAEAAGVAYLRVAEPLWETTGDATCAETYAALLLAALGNPYGRTPRDFAWLARWSARFAPYVDLEPLLEPPSGRSFGIDLAQDLGPLPLHACRSSIGLRRIETQRLQAEMHRVSNALKTSAPETLGLGEDCPEALASRLLLGLYRPWCGAATPRRFERREANGGARLCYGFEAIHYHVQGREFTQPAHARAYSRTEMEEIVTFRYQLDPSQALHVRTAQIKYTVEDWAVADQSVVGFRLLRVGAGVRVEYGQLLGLLPPDGGRHLLCRVSWLMYYASGALMIGVSVLPGLPQALAARRAGLGFTGGERFARAFLLPAMPALGEADTLVLPKGWFSVGRTLEIVAEHRLEVRLTGLRTEGSDFDRVSFEPLRRLPGAEARPGAQESGR